MVQKSFSYFLVFDKYMTISGFQIEETIDRETSGHLEQLLLAVGRFLFFFFFYDVNFTEKFIILQTSI